MAQYIEKSALVAEIKTRIETYNKGYANGDDCRADALETFLHDIDTLEVIEMDEPNIPKHSYFETIYHCGSEPRWKVGDVLAVYEFYRDYEGEEVFGKVIDVYKDEEDDDWVYVFEGEGGGVLCERELVSDEAYRKN